MNHIPCARITILIIAAALTGIKMLKAITNYTSRRARGNINIIPLDINTPRPTAPYNPEFITSSTGITQETTRLNQAMESNIRDRTISINQAVNFTQLMGFDSDDLTQYLLEEYLMTAMEMEDSTH